jgi:hypothetical protein
MTAAETRILDRDVPSPNEVFLILLRSYTNAGASCVAYNPVGSASQCSYSSWYLGTLR